MKGVAWALVATGRKLRGFDALLASDIPMGAGMSSSAAVCIGSAVALAVASGIFLEARELATLSQRAENEWVGVESGIMDPLVMAGGHHGSAQLIDCRDLTIEDIPVPSDTVAAVLDTGTRRGHVSSAYNERRSECLEAARQFGVASLRDLDRETLEGHVALVCLMSSTGGLATLSQRTIELYAPPPRSGTAMQQPSDS